MQHLVPWLSLKSVPGIGNLLFKRLIDTFGSPEAVLSAPTAGLCRVNGISGRLAQAISKHKIPAHVYRELEMVHKHAYQIVTLENDTYPQLLRQIPDPPPILYVYGHLQGSAAAVAVVGSRKASTYGLTTTRRLCEGLAAHGVTVVSGMARGIDTAAHYGALAGNGRTIAVMGTGLLQVYPPENVKLLHKIAENGAVVTEFCMASKPQPHHFPMRNRIISGMSLGTVVVEAAKRSGSLITARLAAEQGREVFAVPGSVHAANAKGPHGLIQQGAKLVSDVGDILEEIDARIRVCRVHGSDRSDSAKPGALDLQDEEKQALACIDAYPIHVDALARRLSMDMNRLNSVLVQLELKGFILKEPGNYYIRHIEHNEE